MEKESESCDLFGSHVIVHTLCKYEQKKKGENLLVFLEKKKIVKQKIPKK